MIVVLAMEGIEAMTRKPIFIGSVVALALVVGAAVTGTSLAQKGQFSHIYAEKDGDSTVVAVVDGKDITRGDVRIPAESHRAMDPSLTEDDSKKKGILVMVTKRAVEAEVERRELVPTEAEAEDFRRTTKDACLGSDGQACRDAIEEMGYTFDEYWTVTLPEYQRELGKINLFQAVYADQGLSSDSDDEDLLAARDQFSDKLRSEATITWNDEDLKRLYDEAVSE